MVSIQEVPSVGAITEIIPPGARIFRADGSEVRIGDTVTEADGDLTMRVDGESVGPVVVCRMVVSMAVP